MTNTKHKTQNTNTNTKHKTQTDHLDDLVVQVGDAVLDDLQERAGQDIPEADYERMLSAVCAEFKREMFQSTLCGEHTQKKTHLFTEIRNWNCHFSFFSGIAG